MRDLTRRDALMRLGLVAGAAYAAPVFLTLSQAHASEGGGDGGSGGGDDGGDSDSGGGDGPSAPDSASSPSPAETVSAPSPAETDSSSGALDPTPSGTQEAATIPPLIPGLL